jgi:hypothetical protein
LVSGSRPSQQFLQVPAKVALALALADLTALRERGQGDLKGIDVGEGVEGHQPVLAVVFPNLEAAPLADDAELALGIVRQAFGDGADDEGIHGLLGCDALELGVLPDVVPVVNPGEVVGRLRLTRPIKLISFTE